MSDESTLSDLATSALRQRFPLAQDPVIYDVKDPFLGGKLVSINFNSPRPSGGIEKLMCRVLVKGKKSEVYGHDEHLLTVIGQTYSKSIRDLLSGELISGIIAILLTLTICYLALGPSPNAGIPDVLANALTVILGFYFGRSTAK